MKRFKTLYNVEHFGNPLEMVQILFENRFENVEGKNILLVCVHYPHSGECVIALHVIIFFCKNLKLSKEFEIMLSTLTVYSLQNFWGSKWRI